ncbi:MAG: glycosyltransferase [Sulfitobacter pontiacus]|uniref:glycosyltransferase n=2 Tax=Pseudomonadota TaxID=1224 RepID=UPI00326566D6
MNTVKGWAFEMSQDLKPADVALFLPAFTIGGVERMRLNLAQGFLKAGYSVEMVALDASGPLRDEVPEGVRVIDLGGGRMLGALPKLVRYFQHHKPRTFLSALDYANLVSLWAHGIARVDTRIYIGTHKVLSLATAESVLLREKVVMPALLRRAYPRANGIIAVSDGIADDLVKYLGLPQKRVTVIHNPALTDKVLAQAQYPVEHPWLATPEDAARTIISVGRLDRQKDFPTLLRSVHKLRKTRPDLRVIILGEGPDRTRIAAAATTLGLELGQGGQVDLPGFTTNPYAYMSRAALFVSSSEWEGFGNVHVEALGCGCPVVSTDSPSGPADILENGKYGPLVPVGDAAALATAIDQTLKDPLPSEQLHARAMTFHVDRVLENYLFLMQL